MTTCSCGAPLKYGVEQLGEYDGVLYWVCLNDHAYHRFPAGHWLRERAEPHIEQHNARTAEEG
jgi:hypothetical protein